MPTVFPVLFLLAGITIWPAATRSPTRAAGMPSLAATALICPVVSPLLACSNCVMWSPSIKEFKQKKSRSAISQRS